MSESPPKSPEEPKPQGMDAFPSLDEPAPTSEVRVTGFGGLEGDEDREKFESAFPDLSGEVPQEQVSQAVRAGGPTGDEIERAKRMRSIV
jgi:hypothetical protein